MISSCCSKSKRNNTIFRTSLVYMGTTHPNQHITTQRISQHITTSVLQHISTRYYNISQLRYYNISQLQRFTWAKPIQTGILQLGLYCSSGLSHSTICLSVRNVSYIIFISCLYIYSSVELCAVFQNNE